MLYRLSYKGIYPLSENNDNTKARLCQEFCAILLNLLFFSAVARTVAVFQLLRFDRKDDHAQRNRRHHDQAEQVDDADFGDHRARVGQARHMTGLTDAGTVIAKVGVINLFGLIMMAAIALCVVVFAVKAKELKYRDSTGDGGEEK